MLESFQGLETWFDRFMSICLSGFLEQQPAVVQLPLFFLTSSKVQLISLWQSCTAWILGAAGEETAVWMESSFRVLSAGCGIKPAIPAATLPLYLPQTSALCLQLYVVVLRRMRYEF